RRMPAARRNRQNSPDASTLKTRALPLRRYLAIASRQEAAESPGPEVLKRRRRPRSQWILRSPGRTDHTYGDSRRVGRESTPGRPPPALQLRRGLIRALSSFWSPHNCRARFSAWALSPDCKAARNLTSSTLR